MIIKFLFGIFLPPSQGTHTSSSISYVRAVLLGVFISGPCFIVANTHHQVPQWTINHLHSITYTSSAERVKIHQQTTLTWMIIAGTSKVQLRLLYLCEFSTLSASQPEPSGWGWHWNQRHIFFLAARVEGDIPSLLLCDPKNLWKPKIPPQNSGPVPLLKIRKDSRASDKRGIFNINYRPICACYTMQKFFRL